MMKLTKKRVVLFLLFIFPLICFLILSTGTNNFSKLPVVTSNVVDISTLDSSNTFKGKISVVCFLGNDMDSNKGGFFNLNEKIYKKFIEYNQFQIIAVYPEGKENEVAVLKKEIGAFTDMVKWKFTAGSKEQIKALHAGFNSNDKLSNFYTSNVFLIDKNGGLRGRVKDADSVDGKLFGYNMNSVSVLNAKLKDDVLVLYYEYYAAFKENNKNKADRKEVGL
ncbi:hypothetical protein H0I29_05540 [Polaribacter sp. R2A056_3_33]|uniref:hypothetical protein n=1 Tax=Polaribacter sp. R2A056_3_33 TaxID=2745563 RepID=UPI001C4E33C6|nr:hypothetical protein [Polaribacter sp. R2A056_3_33]QXP71547.1 hypothetical protein H0I29_05540 [Polaribacter sp. R2A056_3_33]